jgi:hypothetical protein
MRFMDLFGKKRDRVETSAELDLALSDEALQQALKNFRQSVHAWSEAEFGRTRPVAKTLRQRSWRLAAGWALSTVLVAGSVSGGVYDQHRRAEMAKAAAAAQAAQQQRVVAEQRAREDEEDLLAKVDSDVSKEVPSAMEPLAQLMAEDDIR